MKIAFIGQKGIPARIGGVEAHVEALATRLAARGHDVEVYVRRWYQESNETSYQGVHLRPMPTIPTKHLDATVHSLLSAVNGLFQGFDILHFHTIGPGAFALLPSACGVRSVLTVHSLDWQRAKWSRTAQSLMRVGEKVAVRSASSIITVSSALAEYVRKQHGRPATMIPNGVEIPDPSPAGAADTAALEAMALTPGKYALFLGRFVPEKRLEWLIASFRELIESGLRDFKLVIAGDANDDYARTVVQLAEGLPCVFPGRVEGERKRALLQQAGLAVLPSSLEGFPIFLLEAMAAGVPCLASSLPPHRELLADGRGQCFDRDDREALTAAFRIALAASPDARRTMTESARRYVEAHHSWDHVADATEAVYEGVVGTGRKVA